MDERSNGVSRVCPPEGEPGHPYIESGDQVTVERWVLPTRVVKSPREGEGSKLCWQAILSCLGIIVHLGMVVVVLVVDLLPMMWLGTAWCYRGGGDGTVYTAVVLPTVLCGVVLSWPSSSSSVLLVASLRQ
jgi:hypothetical protein